MRILHTADWHLCDQLGRLNRTDDLKRRVERVAELCDEHGVELLLIAGDLFSEQATVEQMTDALDHVRRTFAGFFARGGTVLAITGNHDRDARINMVRAGMLLAVPHAGAGGVLAGGRLYLQNGCTVARLRDAAGQVVQFVLVPYPFANRYGLSATGYSTKEAETSALQTMVKDWILRASGRDDFDAKLHTVLVAHLFVRGSELMTAYKVTERDDVLFDFADLNPAWAYVALGHIHKPQTLGGANHVRYPGSLDRLDFGETHGDHGVILFDLGPDGLTGEPTRLPIAATPFHTLDIADADAELPGLAAKYPDAATAVVRLRVKLPLGVLSRIEVEQQLKAIFPRRLELSFVGDEPDAPTVATPSGASAGFDEVVRDYLTAHLDGDADRDAVLELADQFLATPEAT